MAMPIRTKYPGATFHVMACGSHVQEMFQSGLGRGTGAQQGLDGVLEQGLGARADVGGGRLVATLSDGLVRADVGGAAVAITSDGNEVTGLGLLGKELELNHRLARQMQDVHLPELE